MQIVDANVFGDECVDMRDASGRSLSQRERGCMVGASTKETYRERLSARRALLARSVDRLVEICRQLPDVRAVYVFGSFARDSVRIRSDLDVLVVRDTTVRRADRDLDIRLVFDVPVGLDLIVVTPSEYKETLSATSFGKTIIGEAIHVYAA